MVGMGEFGFYCETENHGLRERGDRLPSAAYPRQQISLHRLFRFVFFLLKTTWIYGMVWRGGGDTDRKLGSKLNALQCIVLNNVLKA